MIGAYLILKAEKSCEDPFVFRGNSVEKKNEGKSYIKEREINIVEQANSRKRT